MLSGTVEGALFDFLLEIFQRMSDVGGLDLDPDCAARQLAAIPDDDISTILAGIRKDSAADITVDERRLTQDLLDDVAAACLE